MIYVSKSIYRRKNYVKIMYQRMKWYHDYTKWSRLRGQVVIKSVAFASEGLECNLHPRHVVPSLDKTFL